MSWFRGRNMKLTKVAGELVSAAEINIYQPSTGKTAILKRPLQHLALFEIVDSKHGESSKDIGSNSTPTRHRSLQQ